MRLSSLLKNSLLGLGSLLLVQHTNAQITVTPGLTGTQLMDYITGTNVTVSNAVLSCDVDGSGTFIVTGTTPLGLDSGIVLTSGKAIDVVGAASIMASGSPNTPGDADLSATISALTYDACRLEFDFVSTFDTVLFYYSFGSEEYTSYTCSNFNDAFAFYISGPGITGLQNMALVPGTNIPVAINSINSGTPSSGLPLTNCTAMGAGSPFTTYYYDNTGGTEITYDGLTTVLEAKAPVVASSTYHMVMVVGDVMDGALDSGVFLRGSSFTSKPAIPNSVPETTGSKNFIIAPNPSEEFISIYTANDMMQKTIAAYIQNEIGQAVYSYNGVASGLSADMQVKTRSLAPGNYFVTIAAEGLREVTKVQKLR